MAAWMEALSDNLLVDKSRCTFCGECVDKCIVDNLRLRIAPCRKACPLDMNCHGYAVMVARGQADKALRAVSETAPFPRILGRVCSAPCEHACSRNSVDGQAVALRALKRYLGDSLHNGEGNGHEDRNRLAAWKTTRERTQRVAIVGGGPAGVMAACWLRREGYRVMILEAGSRLGGMLSRCVPEFRLPRQVAEEELAAPEMLGADIRLGITVDGAGVAELMSDFNAVLIATGAAREKRLGIPGEELPGVVGGVEFLRSVRSGDPIRIGRSVTVIGGGNTAIDTAQTALRVGAARVTVVCLECRNEMPAFRWEVQDALEEGIQIENCLGPTRLLATDGRLSGVEFRRCLSVFDAEGRFAPRFAEERHLTVETDTVIVAIGQEPDLRLVQGAGVEVRDGRAIVDEQTQQTSVARLFVAGDLVTGPKSVVEALAQGKQAAESIHRYLLGIPICFGRNDAVAAREPAAVDTSAAVAGPRMEPPRLALGERRSFAEIEGVFSRERAKAEAGRCLSCGEPYGKHRACWSCLACEVECPENAIEVKVPYLMR